MGILALWRLIVAIALAAFGASGAAFAQHHWPEGTNEGISPVEHIANLDPEAIRRLNAEWAEKALFYNVLWVGDTAHLQGQRLNAGYYNNLQAGSTVGAFGSSITVTSEFVNTLTYEVKIVPVSPGVVLVVLTWNRRDVGGNVSGGSKIIGRLHRNSPGRVLAPGSGVGGGQTSATPVNFGGGGGGDGGSSSGMGSVARTERFWTETSYFGPDGTLYIVATLHTITYYVDVGWGDTDHWER